MVAFVTSRQNRNWGKRVRDMVLEPTDGVRPAVQERSRQTRDRMLRAGLTLVEQRGFDDIAVADIAAAAGCSVGAFYERFKNKEGFFAAMLEVVVAETRRDFEVLAAAAPPDAPDIRAALYPYMDFTVAFFRDRAGLLRAALRRSMDTPEVWLPLRLLALDIRSRFVDLLGRRDDLATRADLEHSIAVILQIVFGALINTIITSPKPLSIDDPALVDELTTLLVVYLTRDPAPGS